LRQLKARYGDIDQLNQAWGTKLKSWEELKAPFQFSGQPFEGRREDLHLFVLSFCRRYFEVVSRAVHEIDPAALYLGCRFAWYGPEAEQAASEYCDVISYNIYDKGISEGRAAAVAKLGKPAIIGEFHFGALDRGMFHPGLVGAANQEERGKMYLAYVESVAENPNFVGCHWFQYRDEPVAGRSFDGENYNIGLVSVADVPYAELVRAAERAHAEAYRLRYGR
jgi:agarase